MLVPVFAIPGIGRTCMGKIMATGTATNASSTPFSEEQRVELADFLRTRRARLTPQAVGLPAGARRKVPGLRREEVAELAGIGATWYTWLEQGREVNVSTRTLEQLADALRLAPQERRYLFALAGQRTPAINTESDDVMMEGLRGMLHGLEPGPAYVVNESWDLVAWNKAAIQIFGNFEDKPVRERNLMWLLFTDPYFRKLHLDWDAFAYCILMGLRGELGSVPNNPRLAEVTSALRQSSKEFRAWWSTHDVILPVERSKVLRHPKAGRLTLHLSILQVFRSPHLKLFSFTPVEGTDTAQRLVSLLGR
jgi:transcriptional regulator with XRE-family HTH domain